MAIFALVSVLGNILDTERNLLFTHIPKNAGTSVTIGMENYVRKLRIWTARTCKDYDYLQQPESGMPGRRAAKWFPRRDIVDPFNRLEACPQRIEPQCDLTKLGMGCIGGLPGGVYHQDEEYARAELTVCSHDGLPPILAPDANGIVTPIVSFAIIRHPMVCDGQRR